MNLQSGNDKSTLGRVTRGISDPIKKPPGILKGPRQYFLGDRNYTSKAYSIPLFDRLKTKKMIIGLLVILILVIGGGLTTYFVYYVPNNDKKNTSFVNYNTSVKT